MTMITEVLAEAQRRLDKATRSGRGTASELKQELRELVIDIEQGKFLSGLSASDKGAAITALRHALKQMPTTNNPAAAGLALAEDSFRRIVDSCPNLDPDQDKRGRGHLGYVGALTEFAEMVRDAAPAPGTPANAVEARRKLFGIDPAVEDPAERKWEAQHRLSDAVETFRRVRRRKRSGSSKPSSPTPKK